jgi:transposase
LPVRLALTPGQAHDVTAARQLLDQAVVGSVVLADRSYDVDWVVDLVRSQGGRANIPMYVHRKRNRRDFDPELYKSRNLIERFFNKLKQFRRIATRYDKTARNFLAMTQIAATRLWAKFESTP